MAVVTNSARSLAFASIATSLPVHELCSSTRRAVRPGTHILFVGDVDQLPSVGAGDVLRNMISSGVAPIVRLSVIFRQAADSKIITNAHLINQGKFSIFSKESGDFFLFPAEDATAAADWIVDVVSERIPQKFGFDAVQDIQVLSPIYRGPAGVIALNERLQEKLNPSSRDTPERKLYGTIFRIGDKVRLHRTEAIHDREARAIGWDTMGIGASDGFCHLSGIGFDAKRNGHVDLFTHHADEFLGELLRAEEDEIDSELASAPTKLREFPSQFARPAAHGFENRTGFIEHHQNTRQRFFSSLHCQRVVFIHVLWKAWHGFV